MKIYLELTAIINKQCNFSNKNVCGRYKIVFANFSFGTPTLQRPVMANSESDQDGAALRRTKKGFRTWRLMVPSVLDFTSDVYNMYKHVQHYIYVL